LLTIKGSSRELLDKIEETLDNETGEKGVTEMKQVFDFLEDVEVIEPVVFDLTLARGLDYYTGTIFEVSTSEMEMGSICGGGRYDDLTGIFGLEGVSGVGISFGADRIYDVLNKLDRFPEHLQATTQVMLVNFGEKEQPYCLKVLEKLRKENISAELYPDPDKMKKQMKYADQKGIPFVVLIGEDEMKSGKLSVKNMRSGQQEKIGLEEMVRMIADF
jgi:histidyl-tRNA synthetase